MFWLLDYIIQNFVFFFDLANGHLEYEEDVE